MKRRILRPEAPLDTTTSVREGFGGKGCSLPEGKVERRRRTREKPEQKVRGPGQEARVAQMKKPRSEGGEETAGEVIHKRAQGRASETKAVDPQGPDRTDGYAPSSRQAPGKSRTLRTKRAASQTREFSEGANVSYRKALPSLSSGTGSKRLWVGTVPAGGKVTPTESTSR